MRRYNNHAGFMVGALSINMRVLQNRAHAQVEEGEQSLHSGPAYARTAARAGGESEDGGEGEGEGLLEEPLPVTTLKRALRLIAWHFNWGFRFIFFSIPFFFYAAGTCACACACVCPQLWVCLSLCLCVCVFVCRAHLLALINSPLSHAQ